MSRPGNPYDNAACESFMKTLKQEKIYCNQYANFDQLWQNVEEFIGAYYNRLRLHSALGYRTPEEFEREAPAAPAASGGSPDAPVLKFSTASRRSARAPGKRTRRQDHALLIVRDAFRTGYSLIGLLASVGPYNSWAKRGRN
jgi:hypothetical protein